MGRFEMKKMGAAHFTFIFLCLSFLLRLSMFEFESLDMTVHFLPWVAYIRSHQGMRAFKAGFSNYPPLYCYFLYLVSLLPPSIPSMFPIKIFSVAFDYLCAYYAFHIVKSVHHHHGGRPDLPYWAAAAVLMSPTMILNSSFWGQCDAIYTAGILGSIFHFTGHRNMRAMFLLGLAFSIKPQTSFIALLPLTMLLGGQLRLRDCLIPIGVYSLSLIPSLLVGRPLLELFSIYGKNYGLYQQLTMNAPSLYAWFAGQEQEILSRAGLFLTSCMVLLFAFWIKERRPALTPQMVVAISFFSVTFFPYFLPRMHDRYFFPADILSIIFVFSIRGKWPLAALMNLTSFFSYLLFLFGVRVLPLQLLALVPAYVLYRVVETLLTLPSKTLTAAGLD